MASIITTCFFSAALQMWTCYQNVPTGPAPLAGQAPGPGYNYVQPFQPQPSSLQPLPGIQPLKPLGDMELP